MALPAQTPRVELIRKFRALGWSGPVFVRGRDHPFMVRGSRKQKIPNPHTDPIHVSLLKRILHQAGITDDQWNGA